MEIANTKLPDDISKFECATTSTSDKSRLEITF